ncbi:MAG: DUF4115 domain-containing protein [Acidobacteria bacterium]|jgi:transcriptional regulator with XRE-family HTH domain|nr:DUF4115 domain-containing protein [Acidobacteriota bacterium]
MNKIGEALKHEREKRNISLEYIAAQTNININALTALENDRCQDIPGGFYFKNYLKSYLKALDADVEGFLENHKEMISASYNRKVETPNTYCTKLKYSRFKKRNIFIVIPTVIILAAFLVYLGYNKKEIIINGWQDLNKKPVSIPIPQCGIDFAAHTFQENFNHDYPAIHVEIEFNARCWILVNRGKEKIIEKTFQPGERFETGGYNLMLYLDNPPGVRFLINGREVTYLQKRTRPEKIMLTPVTLSKIFEVEQAVVPDKNVGTLKNG